MIYLVEDEENIRELVLYTLTGMGFEALGFPCAEDFRAALNRETPDLVILDVMLPGGEDGVGILKKLRASERFARIPVLMLTAKSTEYDKVLGLDAGADDYMAKPFGMMELVARVKSLLRRAGRGERDAGADDEEYRIGALSVNVPKHRARVGETDVVLTLKEFDLLLCLARNPGVVLTRNRLLESVWGYDFDGETRTVDVHIRSLRVKLGSCGDVIRTVRGVGYKIGETP